MGSPMLINFPLLDCGTLVSILSNLFHSTLRTRIEASEEELSAALSRLSMYTRSRTRVSRMCNMNTMLILILLQAGGSPWENAVQQLQNAFTGPIAKGLCLVAIVVGGLMFAFGEGGNKRMFAGILFGVGMAIAAVNFLAWLFPGA
jgi:type IV secretory pathway VirB2 component (pilin)